jgi:hypothetical protein
MVEGQYTKKYTGNSRDVILKGKISWHRLTQPDEEQKWKVTLYPDAESLEEINKLKSEGLMNVLRKDEEGYNMTFTRYRQKMIRGKIVLFEAPIVLDKEGKPTDGFGIGHGSDVSIKLQVYKYNKPNVPGTKGIAARLEGVRVWNLVPFERERDMDASQVRQVKGLAEATEPIW